jgi:hypothetical protein
VSAKQALLSLALVASSGAGGLTGGWAFILARTNPLDPALGLSVWSAVTGTAIGAWVGFAMVAAKGWSWAPRGILWSFFAGLLLTAALFDWIRLQVPVIRE